VWFEHGDQMIMIRKVQRQHDCSPWRLFWDSSTAMFDNSIANADEMDIFCFMEFTLEIIRIGCMEEWSSEELTNFVQLMIVYLIRGSQEDSCVGPCKSVL
jgi:hypothetical protein